MSAGVGAGLVEGVCGSEMSLLPSTVIKLQCKGKGKSIYVQAWTGPEDARRSRIPDFMTIGTFRL